MFAAFLQRAVLTKSRELFRERNWQTIVERNNGADLLAGMGGGVLFTQFGSVLQVMCVFGETAEIFSPEVIGIDLDSCRHFCPERIVLTNQTDGNALAKLTPGELGNRN